MFTELIAICLQDAITMCVEFGGRIRRGAPNRSASGRQRRTLSHGEYRAYSLLGMPICRGCSVFFGRSLQRGHVETLMPLSKATEPWSPIPCSRACVLSIATSLRLALSMSRIWSGPHTTHKHWHNGLSPLKFVWSQFSSSLYHF